MNPISAAELRRHFLEYFKNKNHTIVPSSPLVPANDPTLLFTNAGMVQFKEIFLGLEKPAYQRAVSAQRCIRAGGKHNDLENVGYTARHHTFFEMLGNFSFGDYFKRDAITYAWEFLTLVLKIPAEKLWITVFRGDDEAADIWLKELKVNPKRFSRCDEKDNFWAMGDTGPCGPCSEIFYDHGPEIAGGPPGTPEQEGDRYIEIWNLVFMQYERTSSGELTPLPAPSVDTGMGLERLAAVMQGVHNNYDTDLFRGLIETIAKLANYSDLTATSLRVVADHIRACAFLITDGVMPSNEGRGYVLRRILRRALRHGTKLGLHGSFFHKLVKPLAKDMGEAYPELTKAQSLIERVLSQEEQQFAKTLNQGLKILEQDIAKLTNNVIPGTTVFRLYDTYGFPVDLTADIARERGLQIDLEGFEHEMAKQRRQSQESSQFAATYSAARAIEGSTDFTGYEHLQHAAKIIAIFRADQTVAFLQSGEKGTIILDRTPFYAEAGGQVGDRGILQSDNGQFVVHDTRKEGDVYVHQGVLQYGKFVVGDTIQAEVDIAKRIATALNHSATHLLNAALRKILGEHSTQKGSLVEAERLRFDFSHYEPLTIAQLKATEHLVNQQIRANYPVETMIMPADQAMSSGAIALFGEKYGEQVRVLRMGDFSKELCGGTHVKYTGDIGLFKIISESGIAAGIRRIEAVTGEYAIDWVDAEAEQLRQISQILKTSRDNVIGKLKQITERARVLEKQIEQLQGKLASTRGDDLTTKAVEIAGRKVLIAKLTDVDMKALRETVDQLKQKLGSAVIILASIQGPRVHVVVGVTSDYVQYISANELASEVANPLGGKGGGRPDMAQAGSDNPAMVDAALQYARQWLEKRFSQ